MDECKPLKHGLALPVVAIAFALMPAVVEKAAVGVKSAEEVRMNVEWLAAAAAVPAELWAEAGAYTRPPFGSNLRSAFCGTGVACRGCLGVLRGC